MRSRHFFRDQAIHFDFQQKRSLKCGDDFSANAMIEEVFEQGHRFKARLFGWLGDVSLLLSTSILFEEHELLFSGPAHRVAVQTACQSKGKLPSEESCDGGRSEFEKKQKSLLGNILGRNFLKPSTDFAISSMNGRHEGEYQNRLAHLGIAGISSGLNEGAENFARRWRAILASFLCVQVSNECAGIGEHH